MAKVYSLSKEQIEKIMKYSISKGISRGWIFKNKYTIFSCLLEDIDIDMSIIDDENKIQPIKGLSEFDKYIINSSLPTGILRYTGLYSVLLKIMNELMDAKEDISRDFLDIFIEYLHITSEFSINEILENCIHIYKESLKISEYEEHDINVAITKYKAKYIGSRTMINHNKLIEFCNYNINCAFPHLRLSDYKPTNWFRDYSNII